MPSLQREDVRRHWKLIVPLLLALIYLVYLLLDRLYPPPPPIDPCNGHPNSCPSGCDTNYDFLNQHGECFSARNLGSRCPAVSTSPRAICFSTTGTHHPDCTFVYPFIPVGGEVYFFGEAYYETTGPADSSNCNPEVTCLTYGRAEIACPPPPPFTPCGSNTACAPCDTSQDFLDSVGDCLITHMTRISQCPTTPPGPPFPSSGILCFDINSPPLRYDCGYLPPPPLSGFAFFANQTYFEVVSLTDFSDYPTNCNINDSICFNYDNNQACPQGQQKLMH